MFAERLIGVAAPLQNAVSTTANLPAVLMRRFGFVVACLLPATVSAKVSKKTQCPLLT